MEEVRQDDGWEYRSADILRTYPEIQHVTHSWRMGFGVTASQNSDTFNWQSKEPKPGGKVAHIPAATISRDKRSLMSIKILVI